MSLMVLILLLVIGLLLWMYRHSAGTVPPRLSVPLGDGQLTAKGIQDKADQVIGPLISDLITFQSQWIQTHHSYWQGLRTPRVVPVDGSDTPPDKGVKPVNDPDGMDWNTIPVQVPSTLPCSVEVFTHNGPSGSGYTIISHITFGEQTFMKAITNGKEGFSTPGWVEVEKFK